MIIIDLINHFGLKAMMRRLKGSYFYKFNFIAYWGFAIGMVITLLTTLLITGYPGLDYIKYRTYFILFGVFMVFYVPRLVFSHFVILQAILYLIKKVFFKKKDYKVKRNIRKNYQFQKLGLFVSVLFGLLVIYGMIWGKSYFKVREVNIYLEKLPSSFEGFRIAQFSDAHLGSFTNPKDVKKGLNLMQAAQPDLIVFTGDMVNNIADEMEPYFDDFKNLYAPYGRYSILGNHDMSDYVKWKNFDMKQEYLQKLIDYQEICGFKMLLNRNVIIKKGDDSIALLGVENWGLPPFKQYGDLQKALDGIRRVHPKILLSHDPTHWTEQVINRTDIDLTLSGHTHGMQMGIDLWGFRWSPIQFLYKNWFGLYQEREQKLYVNPGFGYIGFPGRIGIRPEITVFILHSKDN